LENCDYQPIRIVKAAPSSRPAFLRLHATGWFALILALAIAALRAGLLPAPTAASMRGATVTLQGMPAGAITGWKRERSSVQLVLDRRVNGLGVGESPPDRRRRPAAAQLPVRRTHPAPTKVLRADALLRNSRASGQHREEMQGLLPLKRQGEAFLARPRRAEAGQDPARAIRGGQSLNRLRLSSEGRCALTQLGVGVPESQ